MKIRDLQTEIIKFLDEKKINDIVAIHTSAYECRASDLCIIGSGTSSRHMQSVATQLYRSLKNAKLSPKIEGTASFGWILIEVYGIEIHLFSPDMRKYYDIESLLSSNPSENLEILYDRMDFLLTLAQKIIY
jgi:ribosome-associated protein